MKDADYRRQADEEFLDTPFLTVLVYFSGAVLVIGGTLALLVTFGNAHRGARTWLIDLAVIAALVGWHVAMRVLRARHRHP